MPLLILVVLLGVPYLEFLVFLEVGSAIGGLQALLLTILTAVIGVYLIRQQGLVVMNRMHHAMQRGESPVEDILHGFFLLIAGLFFLLPGFITDTVALLLAIEPIRAVLGKIIVKNIRATFYNAGSGAKNQAPFQEGIIIDGEFEDDPDVPKNIDHKE
ncbi:MAG: exlusion protein FxsA [Alphaproteobacteria bacterium]|nr:MAG: exlusion protein FxsA [Alphaproteobacteria bacterium]